jgi:hypothetical protein
MIREGKNFQKFIILRKTYSQKLRKKKNFPHEFVRAAGEVLVISLAQ